MVLSFSFHIGYIIIVDFCMFIEPYMHLWDEGDLITVDDFLIRSGVRFASILIIGIKVT